MIKCWYVQAGERATEIGVAVSLISWGTYEVIPCIAYKLPDTSYQRIVQY